MATPAPRRTNAVKRRAQTAERIFNRLIEAIVTGTLASGQPMREAGFAKQWGVSRTPLREAVRRAAEAGLLILRRNRAPLVRAFTPHDVDCLYQMREVLEVLALEQAWEHIPPNVISDLKAEARKAAPYHAKDWIGQCLAFDDALHSSWIDHCQNPWLTQSLQRIRTFIRILQRLMAHDAELVRRSYQEHCAVLETLGTRDWQAGITRLREHIRNSSAAVKARIDTH
jgi:DNA-binding GntR family transcriptional regulator